MRGETHRAGRRNDGRKNAGKREAVGGQRGWFARMEKVGASEPFFTPVGR